LKISDDVEDKMHMGFFDSHNLIFVYFLEKNKNEYFVEKEVHTNATREDENI
jgi:hypothetical protein